MPYAKDAHLRDVEFAGDIAIIGYCWSILQQTILVLQEEVGKVGLS